MTDLLTDITARNNGGSVLGMDNSGTALDLTAGFTGNGVLTLGAPSGSTGQQLIPTTGNSVLDSLSAISNLAVNELSKGLGAYSSYLEASAVANAANRLNTTPAAITGSLPTVPTAAQTAAAATAQTTAMYVALAGGAAVILLLVLRKRRRG